MASLQAYFMGPVREFRTMQPSEEQNRKSPGWKWSQRWAEEQRVGILWAYLHLEPVVSWVGYSGALSLCWARAGEEDLRFWLTCAEGLF